MLEEDDGGRRRNSCRFFGQFHFVATEAFGNAQGQAAKVRLCVDLPVNTYHEPCTYGLIRCSAFRVAPLVCEPVAVAFGFGPRNGTHTTCTEQACRERDIWKMFSIFFLLSSSPASRW